MQAGIGIKGRKVLSIVALAAFTLTLSACGSAQSIQPKLTVAGLIGTWKSKSGSMVTLNSDHSVIVRHVDVGPGISGCGTVSGEGTWQFLSATGVGGSALDTYKNGNLVMILMPSIQEACNGWELTTWGTSSSVKLCVASDPDSPCISETFVRIKDLDSLSSASTKPVTAARVVGNADQNTLH